MRAAVDLAPRHLAHLKALLREHVPDAEVWAHGSRVRGGGHEASDLDIVLRGPGGRPVPLAQVGALTDALSESDIPILVDVLDWARVPESFHEGMAREHVVLQEPGRGEGGSAGA
jgi:predicted nucleotidyltransferase